MVALFQQEFQPLFGPARGKAGRMRTFAKLAREAGIYIIRENGVIIYVGMSQSCIVEALYRHFYYWKNDPTRTTNFPRTTYYDKMGSNSYDAAIFVTEKADAPKIERGLILSIQPRDNRERYQSYLDQIIASSVHVGAGGKLEAAALASFDDNEDLPF